jgi:hypothetical protein
LICQRMQKRSSMLSVEKRINDLNDGYQWKVSGTINRIQQFSAKNSGYKEVHYVIVYSILLSDHLRVAHRWAKINGNFKIEHVYRLASLFVQMTWLNIFCHNFVYIKFNQ